MLRITLALVAATAVGAVIFTGDLAAETDPKSVVEERQNLMRTMGRSFGPIVAILQGGDDLAAGTAAAQTIQDSITKAAGLFPEGTGVGEVEGSRAKPEVWDEAEEFEANAVALIEAAGAVANAPDVDAFKAAFPALGQACGACHEAEGSAGGKFRAPK